MEYYKTIADALNSPFLSPSEAITTAVTQPVIDTAATIKDKLIRANQRAFDPRVPADQTFASPPPQDGLSNRIDNSIEAVRGHLGNLITSANAEPNMMKRNSNLSQLEMMTNLLRNSAGGR